MRSYADIYAKEASLEVVSLGQGYFLMDKNTHRIALWEMFLSVKEAIEFVEDTMQVQLIVKPMH